MSLATQLESTAQTLIAQFGTTATLNRLSARTSSGDAWAPTLGAPPTATIRVVDYDEEIRNASGQVTGVTRKMLISTSAGVTPAMGDTVTIGGADHELGPIKPITLQGSTLTWLANLVT